MPLESLTQVEAEIATLYNIVFTGNFQPSEFKEQALSKEFFN